MSVSWSEPGGNGWLRLGGVVELVVEQLLGDGRVSVCGGVRQEVEDHGQVQARSGMPTAGGVSHTLIDCCLPNFEVGRRGGGGATTPQPGQPVTDAVVSARNSPPPPSAAPP